MRNLALVLHKTNSQTRQAPRRKGFGRLDIHEYSAVSTFVFLFFCSSVVSPRPGVRRISPVELFHLAGPGDLRPGHVSNATSNHNKLPLAPMGMFRWGGE
jgi:hypothetical protein